MKIKLKGVIRHRMEFMGDETTEQVWLNDKVLDWKSSLVVRSHSPGGLSWGYSGSGPSQFALAVCLELFGKFRALKVYHLFKERFIAKFPLEKKFLC